MRTRGLPESAQIAIVDDDKAVREALCDLLNVEGLNAHGFDGALAFLNADPAFEFDCLITDVRMPEMDGIALLEHLRASGALLPAIFITSVTDPAARKRALSAGAAAWLTKPVADGAMLEALRTVLANDRDGRD